MLLFLSASLGLGAAAQALQRDDTAIRAFSKVGIRTPQREYLVAGAYSEEERPPVRVSECSTCHVDRWDVITSGKHNDWPGYALIVDTVTQKCLTFDPERGNGRNVYMAPCGGNADGSGGVLTSQLFAYEGHPAVTMLQPLNGQQNGQCLAPWDGYLAVGSCEPSEFNIFILHKRGPVRDD
jgi:hypothetical protein